MDAIFSRIELHESTVVKHFADPEAFRRELAVYQRALPMTPQLLDFTEPCQIILSRCTGKPYLDCKLDREAVALLAETIAFFHKSTLAAGACLCHWDNQPRNILFDGESFTLLDFSESQLAYPEDDITHLLLFWAAEFSPGRMQTLSNAFIQAYLQDLVLDAGRWKAALARSSKRFDLRRSKYCHSSPHSSPAQVDTNRQLIFQLLG